MKHWLQIAALSSVILGVSGAQAATITTEDVIKMTQARVSDDAIVQTIESTGSRFYLNTQDVKRLKSKGVSDRVLTAMQTVKAGTVEQMGEISPTGSSTDTGVRTESTTNTVVRPTYVAPGTSWTYYYPPTGGYYYGPYYYDPPPPSLFSFVFGPGPGPGPGWGPGPGFGPGPGRGPGHHHGPGPGRPPR